MSLGSVFGFLGNFLYGYLPYKIWGCISKEDPIPTGKRFIKYLATVIVASSVCGVFIGWGVDLLGFVPFSALGNIITLNNFVIPLILGPILLDLLYPRVKRWRLLYRDIIEPGELKPSPYRKIGLILVIAGGIGGLILGNVISIGLYRSGFLEAGFGQGVTGTLGMGLGLLPAIVLIFIGTLLL